MRAAVSGLVVLALSAAVTASAAEPPAPARADSPALRAAQARLDAAAKEVADLLAKEHGGAAGPARIELRVTREEAEQAGDRPPVAGAKVQKHMIIDLPDDLPGGPRGPHPGMVMGMHGPFPEGFRPHGPLGDLELATLSETLGRYFGAATGVLVTHAPAGSGLEDGDVITRIGARTVASAERARKILETYGPGESVPLTVTRNRAAMELQWTATVERDVITR